MSPSLTVAETKPEFGGHCAFGLTQGKLLETDCSIKINDSKTGKRFCFHSEEMKADWIKDPAGNTAKAEEGYKKLSGNHGEKGHSKSAHDHDDHEHEMRKSSQ